MRSGHPRGQKYVLVMVGLPARGKTYTARKLSGYLNWLGYETQVFNVGAQRRSSIGAKQSHDFFDPANREAERVRRDLAIEVLEEALAWLTDRRRVAIYDATNSSRERRAWVRRACEERGHEVVFIELINDDAKVIEDNVRATKLTSPDYAGMDPDLAVQDFRARIAHYEQAYEPVEDDEGSYLKLIDRGRQVRMNEIDGYLPARIVFFLTNLQITDRPIWLTRHGESEFNVRGLIGGDSALTDAGRGYARNLAGCVREHFDPREIEVWTSTLRRTIQTAEPLRVTHGEWRVLDEIDAGVCDGMSYGEIAQKLPKEFRSRTRDKLRYRYPRGESYEDVIQRVDRVIIELERQRVPVLVIAHQAVVRALYSYFMGLPTEETPHVHVPLHTVIALTPQAYGCDEQRIALGPAAEPASSSS